MPSALIWSMESVVLGLWALALAPYSTPLHVFIARCHVLISAFTTVLHLVVIVRNLVVGSAVSQAFLCAVSALFLVYIAAMLDADQAKFFRLPSVGLLTLDAVIGCAWFSIAMLSGLGMALSFVEKETASQNEIPSVTTMKLKQTTQLMFHDFGVHLVVFLPCLALARWQVIRVIGIALWSTHMVYKLVSFFDVNFLMGIANSGTNMGLFLLGFLKIVRFLSRFASVGMVIMVIPFIHLGSGQSILVFCILGVAIVTSFDAFEPLVMLVFPSFSGFPAIDRYFAAPKEDVPDRQSGGSDLVVASEPVQNAVAPLPGSGSGFGSRMWFPARPSYLPRHADPAAVPMLRAKMV